MDEAVTRHGHQLLPSNPKYGGDVKTHAVGAYSFPCTDNPNTHTTDSVGEETFGDGIGATAEIAFYAKRPKAIKGSPTQYVSDPTTDVLHELRLYHWTAAALFVADAWAHLLHVARDNGWNLEQDFE
eukprot:2635621-Pyramimonas_sp.AAC.1